jgi:hypothetical protein
MKRRFIVKGQTRLGGENFGFLTLCLKPGRRPKNFKHILSTRFQTDVNTAIRKVPFHSARYLAGGGAPPLTIYGSHQLCRKVKFGTQKKQCCSNQREKTIETKRKNVMYFCLRLTSHENEDRC